MSNVINVVKEMQDIEPKKFGKTIMRKQIENQLQVVNKKMSSLEKELHMTTYRVAKETREVGCKWIFEKKEGVSKIEKLIVKHFFLRVLVLAVNQ